MANPPAINGNASNHEKNPPFFKLHKDLIWRIFQFNADLDDETPLDRALSVAAGGPGDSYFITNRLTVILQTSQVCHFWRSLILKSTATWGRLIKLNILKYSLCRWSDEVLKRAGEAPLDVKGGILGLSPDMTPFFWSLVQHHWASIRCLDITIFGAPWISEDAWDFLERSAPLMQELVIDILNGPDGYRDKLNLLSKSYMGFFGGVALVGPPMCFGSRFPFPAPPALRGPQAHPYSGNVGPTRQNRR
jgi:hypothetical protein